METVDLYSRQTGEGEPLISVHGLFGSQENLGAINRKLAERFTVHGVDVRNHGRSPHADIMDYPSMARDVVRYMDLHNLDQVHMLGHSMGGKIAMEVALSHPRRIHKLAVLDIAPVAYRSDRHEDVFRGLQALHPGKIESRQQADAVLANYIQTATLRSFLLKNMQREGDHFRWRINLEAIRRGHAEIMAGQSSSGPFAGETLFLKGEYSNYVTEEYWAKIAECFPRAHIHQVSGTGHWLHSDKPELVGSLLADFF